MLALGEKAWEVVVLRPAELSSSRKSRSEVEMLRLESRARFS